jgi:hypothetical protein
MKTRRRQIGPRINEATHEGLRRLAAAAGENTSSYAAEVLSEHVAHPQGRSTDEGALRQLEQRLMEAIAGVQSGIQVAAKRLEREINAVKAMIDASVEARDPEHAEEYRRLVAKILRAWGMQVGTGNGVTQ